MKEKTKKSKWKETLKLRTEGYDSLHAKGCGQQALVMIAYAQKSFFRIVYPNLETHEACTAIELEPLRSSELACSIVCR